MPNIGSKTKMFSVKFSCKRTGRTVSSEDDPLCADKPHHIADLQENEQPIPLEEFSTVSHQILHTMM